MKNFKYTQDFLDEHNIVLPILSESINIDYLKNSLDITNLRISDYTKLRVLCSMTQHDEGGYFVLNSFYKSIKYSYLDDIEFKKECIIDYLNSLNNVFINVDNDYVDDVINILKHLTTTK